MKSLKQHRFGQNPQEKILVDEFTKQFSRDVTVDLIVFGHPPDSVNPKDYLSDRERDIVVSTIQWLGSHVGECFLESCGYVKAKGD